MFDIEVRSADFTTAALSVEVPIERLEAEITTLAGHLAAATCRWLGLVAEFDRRGGWRAWEQASCAAWLSWQCGMSPTTAHDHVRVARALENLPETRSAFGAGRLSYSKVRAITRVATRRDEDGWVSAALGATASQLDRLVAACARVTRAESERRVDQERVSWRYDEHGMLVLSARLAPERGARLLAALEQQQHAATEHHSSDGIPGDDSGDGPGGRPSAETVAPCGQASAEASGSWGPSSAEDYPARPDDEDSGENASDDGQGEGRACPTAPPSRTCPAPHRWSALSPTNTPRGSPREPFSRTDTTVSTLTTPSACSPRAKQLDR